MGADKSQGKELDDSVELADMDNRKSTDSDFDIDSEDPLPAPVTATVHSATSKLSLPPAVYVW